MHVVVIGAGVTGLATALELQSRGARVTLLEQAPRVGGVVTTVARDGWLVESGPSSFASNAVLDALVEQLGLASDRIGTRSLATRRYIVRGGRLVSLPRGPGSLVATRALSVRAKVALLCEPFVRSSHQVADESVASLVRRRLNAEILDYLVNPLVAGLYAGDPERLSVRHAMPRLHEAEQQHGSLLRGVLRGLRGGRGAARSTNITSFLRGLQTLPNAMAAALGGSLQTGKRVVRVERRDARWRLTVVGATRDVLAADAVICTVPAGALTAVGLPTEVGDTLAPIARIAHPPLATLALGFRREDVAHPLDGFGVLTPAIEQRVVLGAAFSSSIFEGRAPEGHVLITCFLGGVRAPELGRAPEADVLPRVLDDLRPLLGLRAAPVFTSHQRWPEAIPQYEMHHQQALDAAEGVERALPGLYLSGQWRFGVALGDCIAHGQAVAARAVREGLAATAVAGPSARGQ